MINQKLELSKPRTQRHIAALDGLRGLAIIMVMWYHSGTAFGFPGGLGPVAWLQHLGYTGVDLFFVLSGFLITRILLETRGRPRYLVSFYVRRSLRIWPLYFTVLGAICLGAPFILKTRMDDWGAWLRGVPFYFVFLTNFYLAAHGSWLMSITDITWSVCIEEQFYLVWPLIICVVSKRGLLVLCPLLLVMGIGSRLLLVQLMHDAHWFPAYFLPNCRVDPIAIGALLAASLSSDLPDGRGRVNNWLSAGILGIAMLTILSVGLLSGAAKTAFGVTLSGVGYGLLLWLAVVARPAFVASILESRVLAYAGRVSYGLYLVHLIAAYSIKAALPNIGTSLGAYLLQTTLMMLISVVLAETSWRVIERPALTLKRIFPRPEVSENSFVVDTSDGDNRSVRSAAAGTGTVGELFKAEWR